jgi:very-short-patch-repair endonuclease
MRKFVKLSLTPQQKEELKKQREIKRENSVSGFYNFLHRNNVSFILNPAKQSYSKYASIVNLILDASIKDYKSLGVIKWGNPEPCISHRTEDGTFALAVSPTLFETIISFCHITREWAIRSDLFSPLTYTKFRGSRRRKKKERECELYSKSKIDKTLIEEKKIDKWAKKTRKRLDSESTYYARFFFTHLPAKIKKQIIRQCPVKIHGRQYFLDMYYKPKRVAIEIDGGYHTSKEQKERDEQRDKDLLELGVATIRITNSEAMSIACIDKVAAQIKALPQFVYKKDTGEVVAVP